MTRQVPSIEPALPSTHSDTGAVIALWLITLFVLLNIGGFAFFRSGRGTIAGNPMSLPRSVFTVTNATTLTGFQQSVILTSLQPAGQWCIAILLVAGTFTTLTASTIAVARILRKRWSISFILTSCAIAQFVATVVGGAIIRPPGGDPFVSMFQAASAFGNSGLTIGPVTGAEDAMTYVGMLPLAFVGSLGLPVLIELFEAMFHKQRISMHTRIVLSMSASIFLLGLVACVFFLREAEVGVRPSLASALIASVNSRTAGLPIEYVYDYPAAMQWLLVGLMFIGGAPASCAGGLKLTTLFVLFVGARRALRNEPAGRIFGIAFVWFAIYLLVNFGSMLWLLQSAPEISSDRALFITVSAVSNTGLSPDPLSITAANAYVLSTAMLLGRLLPIGVLWWTASTTRDADVAVG